MRNNRILVIAIILITFGSVGIVATSLGGRYQRATGGWMPPMMNMMGIEMMGRGMMDQNHMKGMMERMMSGNLPPGIKPEDLPEPDSRGARLLERYCSQCHGLSSPMMHTAEEWPAVADRMFARMSMMSGMRGMGMMRMMGIKNPSPEEQETITAYLKKHSMKTISPGTIPSPGSQGAALFKNRCSLCHPLPDPALHTAEEWPMIVERMKGHTQSMGKAGLTGQEYKEIISYLKKHARN
jgi:cytochrome c5